MAIHGTITGDILATAYFLYFQLSGILLIFTIYKKEKPLVKLLIGSAAGSLMLAWLPVLFAFFFDFTLLSHMLAALAALPVYLAAFLRRKAAGQGFCRLPQRDKSPAAGSGTGSRDTRQSPGNSGSLLSELKEHRLFILLLLFVMAFWAYLLHTHTLLPQADGSLWAGQCTYGDMNMHLGFITSIATQQAFPPEYSIMPGVKLSYPFLSDSISSSLYLFGSSLRLAYILPMLFAMAQVFGSVYLFAHSLFHSLSKAFLTLVLFFLNGGLGFAYFLNWAREPRYALSDIFTGFYLTPTNLVNENIRWVNIIADMLLPQRATLFGYAALLPALWLLYQAAFGKGDRRKYFPLAGFFAAALPMIHTHSFLSAGIVSAVWLLLWLRDRVVPESKKAPVTGGAVLAAFLVIMCLLQYLDKKGRITANGLMLTGISIFIAAVIYGICLLAQYLKKNGPRKLLRGWGMYLLPVLILAVPQLLFWTFGQVSEGGFVRGYFNWGNQGDFYLWFYIKNIGVPLLLIFGGICACSRRRAPLFLPPLFLWWLGELAVFTPNTYDNNKLLYVAYLFLCLGAANYGVELWHKVKPIRGMKLFAASFLFFAALSGVLTLGREWVSKYELYSAEQVALAEYVLENTPADAVFLTNTRHNNEIASLAGRNVVCGSDSFLYFHGLDTSERKNALRLMLEDPAGHLEPYEKYKVSYVIVSQYERGSYSLNGTAFDRLFTPVYSSDRVTLYKTGFQGSAD